MSKIGGIRARLDHNTADYWRQKSAKIKHYLLQFFRLIVLCMKHATKSAGLLKKRLSSMQGSNFLLGSLRMKQVVTHVL